MMRKIGYLPQPEFEGIKFPVGAERRWSMTVMICGGRIDLPTMEYEGEGTDFRVAVQVASFQKEVEVHGEQIRCLEREIQASKRKVVEQQRRILHLESQVQPRRRTRVTAHKSVSLPWEQQRFVVEI
ncbi:hypothetical protein GUJ93_ZPchr0010g10252 [Zizania palustris]|uniref:Uncharacterized protein n=1 Tax=Zizania palustris TaxID=103762 RepID=A0A8J5VT60_ZIZPA|nr:hypothetical protein GUJ93_ZPchr0010g10252 [Zizania palustris]